eukprot:NODE_4572_length_1874_cov_5.365770.p1 GENE.NODE_4572_length_1874_cov_5.365770~~NODE_4572_length_1874_cov_5.365770.p1  ORF type:complete len:309 (+),score=75.67 NODE_4572_length_1874_cov_5.365770:871-1797(+)
MRDSRQHRAAPSRRRARPALPRRRVRFGPKQLPARRAPRKRQQLESVAACASAVLGAARKPLRIVDFCCGTGHLGLLLAVLHPKHEVVLVDRNDHAAAAAVKRAAELTKASVGGCAAAVHVRAVAASVESFAEPFDVAVALHACGAASDLVVECAIARGAAFIVAPCCIGKVNHAVGPAPVCSVSSTAMRAPPKDAPCEPPALLPAPVRYPRSALFGSVLSLAQYKVLASAADFGHGADPSDRASGARLRCKSFLERDRLARAEEAGYRCCMLRMRPASCTPKHDVLVGVPPGSRALSPRRLPAELAA